MKTARHWSVCMLLTASFLALYSGLNLIWDPTGDTMHFPLRVLSNTVFVDYYLIGCIITYTVGVFSMVLAVCVLLKTGFYSIGIMLQGAIICMYILIMILLLRRAFLIEYFFLLLGVGMISLGLLQYRRKIVVEIEKAHRKLQV